MTKTNVYKKLQTARHKLHTTKLEKSGRNKGQGYDYFELSDFLPQTIGFFEEVGLCGNITFSQQAAVLRITDTESLDSFIEFVSHIPDINRLRNSRDASNIAGKPFNIFFSNNEEIKAIGAMQTYIRRYLWIMAMDIMENDIVDRTKEEKPIDKKSVESKVNLDTKIAQITSNIDSITAIADLNAYWHTIDKSIFDNKSLDRIKAFFAARKEAINLENQKQIDSSPENDINSIKGEK